MATTEDEARFRDLHERYQARILAYCLRRAAASDAADGDCWTDWPVCPSM